MLKSEKYKGILVTFKKIRDVDNNYATQAFVKGMWIATTSTKNEALARAKRYINKHQNFLRTR